VSNITQESKSNELLLDTNIVTYLSGDNTWRSLYLSIVIGKRLYISFMTFAELWESACHRGWNCKKLQELRKRLTKDFVLLPFNDKICEYFGEIRCERRNRPISVPDALIAATALAYKLPLVTHNKKDFDNISGLEIITKYTV
jgi:predicted nucleic acid-binding protein